MASTDMNELAPSTIMRTKLGLRDPKEGPALIDLTENPRDKDEDPEDTSISDDGTSIDDVVDGVETYLKFGTLPKRSLVAINWKGNLDKLDVTPTKRNVHFAGEGFFTAVKDGFVWIIEQIVKAIKAVLRFLWGIIKWIFGLSNSDRIDDQISSNNETIVREVGNILSKLGIYPKTMDEYIKGMIDEGDNKVLTLDKYFIAVSKGSADISKELADAQEGLPIIKEVLEHISDRIVDIEKANIHVEKSIQRAANNFNKGEYSLADKEDIRLELIQWAEKAETSKSMKVFNKFDKFVLKFDKAIGKHDDFNETLTELNKSCVFLKGNMTEALYIKVGEKRVEVARNLEANKKVRIHKDIVNTLGNITNLLDYKDIIDKLDKVHFNVGDNKALAPQFIAVANKTKSVINEYTKASQLYQKFYKSLKGMYTAYTQVNVFALEHLNKDIDKLKITAEKYLKSGKLSSDDIDGNGNIKGLRFLKPVRSETITEHAQELIGVIAKGPLKEIRKKLERQVSYVDKLLEDKS